MKHLKTLLSLCCVALLFYNCEDTENPSEKHFNVTNYNVIEIGGNAVIEVRSAETTSDNQTIIVKAIRN